MTGTGTGRGQLDGVISRRTTLPPLATAKDRAIGLLLGAGLSAGTLAAVRSLDARRSTSAPTTAEGTSAGGASPSRWDRTNYQGRTVSLLAGPALALGAAAASAVTPGVDRRLRTAVVVAALGAGGFGLYDDLAGSGNDRGLRGHLRALRAGNLTTGVVKIGGLAATGLVAARLVGRRGPDLMTSGAVVAGFANLFNLLDLRPGRTLKVGLAHAGALALPMPGATLLAAPLGAAAGLLRADLSERTMLGDAGANALGAAIGVAAIATYGRVGRLAHLVGIVGLTLASERVSFSKVIEQMPPLRWLDGLGRRR